MVAQLIDRLPDRVRAALGGDEEALIGLLMLAAEFTWQSRADLGGTVPEIAAEMNSFVDEVADCYSTERPPTDRMCDEGFVLAARVDALAVEVLYRRSMVNIDDDAVLVASVGSSKNEERHLARAHLAALRDAAADGREVTDLDVQAAEQLYRAVVASRRERADREIRLGLRDEP